MTETEERKTTWVKKTWQELKSLGRSVFPIIKPPSGHPGAISGPKIIGKGRTHKLTHFQRSSLGLTNHQRVIIGRARRMGISVREYQRRYCS